MKDFEGVEVIVGESVAVINTLIDADLEQLFNSLEFGTVIAIDENTVKVKIGSETKTINSLKVSKVNADETAEDFIVRLANNVEALQLVQESDILNSMLQGS
jgi:hypothetical protein